MAKNKMIKALGLLFAFLLCISCLFACKPGNNDLVEEANVNVTIDGGSGSGLYKEGERCTAVAEEREGFRFVEWQVYGVCVSTDETYVFEVDFDIELKAIYEALPYNTYTVIANGGRIGQDGPSVMKVKEGETVKIYPEETQSKEFIKWIIGEEESTAYPYELTVTEDIEITAVFENNCMIVVNGGTVDGERSQIVKTGTDVTVVANDVETKYFRYWYILDENLNEIVVSDKKTYTFSLNDSLKIYAKFASMVNVTVVNGTVANTSDTQINGLQGETFTLVADPSVDETKAFIGWFVNDKRVSLEKEYTFVLEYDMHIEARYGNYVIVRPNAPDSSANTDYPTTGIIYRTNSGSIAIDRLDATSSTSMFNGAANYIRFDIYTSPDADKTQPLGSFKVFLQKTDSYGACVESMDGALSYNVISGAKGCLWFNTSNTSYLFNIIKYALGYDYCSGQSYYFAATAVIDEYSAIDADKNIVIHYLSSERSDITTSPIVEMSGAPITKHTVNVVNGTIDGSLTYVTACYGASVTVAAADAPGDDYIFRYWQEVSYNSYGVEVLGDVVSKEEIYSFSVNSDVTLKAVYMNKSDIPKLTTPNNADNYLIYKETNGSWAFDRAGRSSSTDDIATVSMFNTNVDYVIYYLYASPDADKSDYVGRFILKVDLSIPHGGGANIVGSLSLIDGTNKLDIVKGGRTNYYCGGSDGTFVSMVQVALGSNYSNGTDYYYACQAISANSKYLNSEISDISTIAVNFD